jgi:hypothetical protein
MHLRIASPDAVFAKLLLTTIEKIVARECLIGEPSRSKAIVTLIEGESTINYARNQLPRSPPTANGNSTLLWIDSKLTASKRSRRVVGEIKNEVGL